MPYRHRLTVYRYPLNRYAMINGGHPTCRIESSPIRRMATPLAMAVPVTASTRSRCCRIYLRTFSHTVCLGRVFCWVGTSSQSDSVSLSGDPVDFIHQVIQKPGLCLRAQFVEESRLVHLPVRGPPKREPIFCHQGWGLGVAQ